MPADAPKSTTKMPADDPKSTTKMPADDLKSTSASWRRKLHSYSSEVTTICRQARKSVDSEIEADYFRGMFRALDRYYSKFESAYETLTDLHAPTGASPPEFPTEADKELLKSTRRDYYESNVYFEKLNKALKPGSEQVPSGLNTTTIVNETKSNLPVISLPEFDGQILNWPKFRDIFMSIIYKDDSISKMQKYHYLITSLKGPASEVIAHIPKDENGFTLAWDALKKVYDQDRLLAGAYLNQLTSFKPVSNKPTKDALKQFIMKISDSVSAFKQLKIENEGDFILFHLASQRLDANTRERFEAAHKGTAFPTFDQLTSFIRDRILALELVESSNLSFVHQTNTYKNSSKSTSKAFFAKTGNSKERIGKNDNVACVVCRSTDKHSLSSCAKFISLNPNERLTALQQFKGCKNCLSYFHKTHICKSKWTCRYCDRRHNSLLHLGSIVPNPSTSSNDTSNEPKPTVSGISLNSTASAESPRVILGTAIAEIRDARGCFQKIRLVVDIGSQHSFLTQGCLRKLGLSTSPFSRKISGIGETAFEGARGIVNCTIRPYQRDSDGIHTDAVVVRQITNYLPQNTLPLELCQKFHTFDLADPKFWIPAPIDFLLGAELFGEISTGPVVRFNDTSLILYPSIFGKIVIGKFDGPQSSDSTSLFVFSEHDDLHKDLKNFWALEEPIVAIPMKTKEEEKCETHFMLNHYRLSDGKYVVKLPFKNENVPSLIESSYSASKRFFNLESKLKQNCELSKQYLNFMEEYKDLGHMSLTESPSKYIIPHHSITKLDRNKIKLRVVFDGSAKTSNGSLNDQLMIGEKLQKDIRDILLNFRSHAIVFVTDIVKMYRNIFIDPADRSYQHIYWRSKPSDALQVYELNTIVYGLTSSPFLALRVIRQLAIDEGEKHPLAVKCLDRDVYVDDIVTGCNSISEALSMQRQLIDLMKLGGFELSKWASNSKEVLKSVSNNISEDPISLQNPDESSLKILGLEWEPSTDTFSFKINSYQCSYTKRSILSMVARIYDPLGFLAPTVFFCKTFIQEIWKEGLDWDQPLTKSLEFRWKVVLDQLSFLSEIKIPRFVASIQHCKYQFVSFSDASTKGYCAVIYLRTITSDSVKVSLLIAKTKLAPLKTISIPRLELCAAYLLAKLYHSIQQFSLILNGETLPPVFFTDSTIVLGWLNMAPYLLKTFAANRVAEISKLTPTSQWKHVISEHNPSDRGSRGRLPLDLLNDDLWWNGPPWIKLPQDEWPKSHFSKPDELPELKKVTSVLVAVHSAEPPFIKWMKRFSSFFQLLRVIAVIKRGISNHRCKPHARIGSLQHCDIENALHFCIKEVQRYHFLGDNEKNINDFLKRFANLSPFLDSIGIWRVGGRLTHSELPYYSKHPIILPASSHLSIILVDHYHKILLHPGASTLQAIIQTRFWVPNLRRLIRKRNFMCLRCYKLNAKSKIPIMGDLPSYRVQAKRAFAHTGVDFAGPFAMRYSLKRKADVSKIYLCLFVCMETKALHLEAVTHLSTEAFLATFDRFCSRRGLPQEMYSDCGSNFMGASNHLKELHQWFTTKHNQRSLNNHFLKLGIKWNFNPPHAPHFGGIWESGVRSVKRHMKTCAGDTPLTFEELSTLFAKFEAILNSRPLCPLSSDPEESDYLSPGHFLVGGPLVTLPERSLLDCRENLLSRWQLVKRMYQQFWLRWRKEYLITLQRRQKWKTSSPNLQVGNLVLLKDSNSSVMDWPMGRVIATHPGADKVVRVVTIQTGTSTFKRPVAELIPLLPLDTPSYET